MILNLLTPAAARELLSFFCMAILLIIIYGMISRLYWRILSISSSLICAGLVSLQLSNHLTSWMIMLQTLQACSINLVFKRPRSRDTRWAVMSPLLLRDSIPSELVDWAWFQHKFLLILLTERRRAINPRRTFQKRALEVWSKPWRLNSHPMNDYRVLRAKRWKDNSLQHLLGH